MFDILFFTHLCHFNWLFQSSSFLGRVHWFLHSWTCVLWTRQSLVMCSQCLYFADKWIWQKNCLGKAIPQASQQFLRSFFTSIEKGKGRVDCFSCSGRYTETPTWLLFETNFFPVPYSWWIYAEICHRIIYIRMKAFVCVRSRQKAGRDGGRLFLLSQISFALPLHSTLIHLFHSQWFVSVLEVKGTLHED